METPQARAEAQYNARVESAYEEGYGETGEAEAAAVAAVAAALVAFIGGASGAALTPAVVQRVRSRLGRTLQQVGRDLVDVIREHQRRAAVALAEAHVEATTEAADILGRDADLDAVGTGAVIDGLGGDDAEVLTDQLLRRVASEADDVLSNVERAVSAGDEVAGTLGGLDVSEALRTDRDLSAALSSVLAGNQIAEEVGEGAFDAAGLGSLEPEMIRLVVDKVARASHEAGAQMAARSPAVDLVRWELSPFHTAARDYAPDVCDVLAAADPHGYGEGLYHPSVAPALPHPHCQCRVRVVLHEPENWGQDRPRPDRPELSDTTVRGILEQAEGQRTVTEDHVKWQRRALDWAYDQAYESPRGE
jgi:hypothetical protein